METDDKEPGSAENRLAVREVCDSVLQRYYAMEQATAGWEEGLRKQFLSRWIGQLGVMAGEIRQAGICDMVEETEIPAELLEGTESQQARRTLTKEQWLQQCLQRKSLEWDLRKAKKVQAKEDSQLRKAQWKPPPGSRKRRRTDDREMENDFLPDEDIEGLAEAPFEWDEPMIYDG